jgi:hypothetical protein
LYSARAVTYIRNLLIDLKDHKDVGECRDFKAYAEARLSGLRRRASRR